jgi:hypothetical protein
LLVAALLLAACGASERAGGNGLPVCSVDIQPSINPFTIGMINDNIVADCFRELLFLPISKSWGY